MKISIKKIFSVMGIYVALIVLGMILSVLTPDFFTIYNLMNIARQSAINSLIAVGMLLAILTGGIDLSVGSVLALSTVLSAILIKKL